MIDAGTVLGLTEIGSAKETHDFREGGDFQPDLRASIAINPDSELIPVTRANGVTTVVTRPSGSRRRAARACSINLAGWVPSEMTVVDPLALHVEFPRASAGFGRGDPIVPTACRPAVACKKQRDEKVRTAQGTVRQADALRDGRKLSPVGAGQSRGSKRCCRTPAARSRSSSRLAAKPEILEALKLADELKLKVILSGATDAWKVADELKKRDVPVIVGPVMAMPQERYDPYDAPFAAPAKLHAAGVQVLHPHRHNSAAIPAAATRATCPTRRRMAVSYGLPAEKG